MMFWMSRYLPTYSPWNNKHPRGNCHFLLDNNSIYLYYIAMYRRESSEQYTYTSVGSFSIYGLCIYQQQRFGLGMGMGTRDGYII